MQAAELRLRALRPLPGFLPGPGSVEAIRELFRGMLESAGRGGEVRIREVRGKLRGVMVREPLDETLVGGRGWRVSLDYDRRSRRARTWAGDELAGLLADPPEGLDLTLASAYRDLLPCIDGVRAHVHTCLLQGTPRRALRGLGDGQEEARRLAASGLRIAPLESPEEVERVLSWKRDWFSRHPEYGWFCGHPHFLGAQREEMLRDLAEPGGGHYLFWRGDEPVGYFASTSSGESPVWGRVAGMDLQFQPELQGRGLARVAYRRLVLDMLRQKVRTFRGGTSQHGVLALGRTMGRAPLAWCVREGPARIERAELEYQERC